MPPRKGAKLVVGDDIRRFWSKTEVSGSCVIWKGALGADGYGKFMTGGAGRQTTHRAHRWIYQRVLGDIGELYLLHSCDRPACVTLQHLSPGTQKQNAADCVAKGRHVNGTAVLNKQTAGEIRYLHAAGVSAVELARHYGVSKSTIYAINSGRLWEGVPPRKPEWL